MKGIKFEAIMSFIKVCKESNWEAFRILWELEEFCARQSDLLIQGDYPLHDNCISLIDGLIE